MKLRGSRLAMMWAVILSTGCATQSFVLQRGGGAEADEQRRQTFIISGPGQTRQMDAAEVCGGFDNVARVDAHRSFTDHVFAILTFGIYTPATARVFCVEPPEDRLEDSREED